jgi:peptidoglycan/LPS O-acetylase OafA/YrhL
MTDTASTVSSPSERRGRVLAGLAFALGVAFVLNPLYLYTNAEQTTEFSIFFRFVNAALLLYGLCLVAAGWYGRRGDAPTVLGGLVGLGVLLALTGPVNPIPFPVLAWSGVAFLLTLLLGVPGVWIVRRTAGEPATE